MAVGTAINIIDTGHRQPNGRVLWPGSAFCKRRTDFDATICTDDSARGLDRARQQLLKSPRILYRGVPVMLTLHSHAYRSVMPWSLESALAPIGTLADDPDLLVAVVFTSMAS